MCVCEFASPCKQFSSTLQPFHPSVQNFYLTQQSQILSAVLNNGANEQGHSPKVNSLHCNLVLCLSCVSANNCYTELAHCSQQPIMNEKHS